MYILRHPKQGMAPLGISRSPYEPGDGKLTSISTENTNGNILHDGRDCIVLHISDAPVQLLVTAFLAKAGDPVPALRLDKIGLDAPAPTSTPAVPAQAGAPIQIGPAGISIIGHIERSGDLVAAPGETLGEPASGLRLEGFQVMWPDRPDGVDLAYGIEVEGSGYQPVVKTGKFCGTKGAAKRITEVTFSLIGPRAAQFQLEGQASFSGGFRLPIQSAMPLKGPSGLEHLTALQLRAVAASAAQKAPNPWNESARTKVFKAEGKPATAARTVAKAAASKAAAQKTAAQKTAAPKAAAPKAAAPKSKAAGKTAKAGRH